MTTKENEAKDRRVVIVAGAQGVSGNAVLKQYAALPGTTVYGLSRRPSESSGNIQHISVDLLSPDDVKAKLGQLKEITHFFFGAYVEKPTATEKTEVNVRLLRNLLDVLEKNAPALRHITLYQGGKAYGSDLGPYKTPAREDDPRLMPPNFYYDQEDLLRSRQKGELGLPFRFPGPESVYRALYQVTSADLLARATVWAGESPAAQNELFNVTNGDTLRWQHMWPRMAKMLGMGVADPVPFSLVTYMADKRPVWDAIVKKEKLQPIPYEQMVPWENGDIAFRHGFDDI